MVDQVLVTWSGDADGVTVLYAGDATLFIPRLDDCLNALAPIIATDTAWSIATSGDQLNTETGALTGSWSISGGPFDGSGTGGSPLADATQLYIRGLTNRVEGGRRVAGGVFIPGVAGTANSEGEPSATALATLTAAFELAKAPLSAGGWGIWHRPVNGAGGAWHQVEVLRPLSEFSTQRRRRRA